MLNSVAAIRSGSCFEDILDSYGAVVRSVMVHIGPQNIVASFGNGTQQEEILITEIARQFPLRALEVTACFRRLLKP